MSFTLPFHRICKEKKKKGIPGKKAKALTFPLKMFILEFYRYQEKDRCVLILHLKKPQSQSKHLGFTLAYNNLICLRIFVQIHLIFTEKYA